MAIRSVILGCGSYLPAKVMTNAEMAQVVDTSDEWITERTGIKSRHIAAEGELTSDLAYNAALAAMAHAGVTADELDLIVLATATPDNTFPATAVKVQARLGMTRGAAFDVQAVCSGFIYALSVADNFIKAGQARTVLVIGAETFSRILDWNDRTTCVLFGDGAGAVVLRAADGAGTSGDQGILSTHLHSDGNHHDLLYVDGGPSSTQTVGHVRMRGQEVFKHAVVNLADVVKEALSANGLTADAIDWLVPHQANRRIIEGTGRKLKLPAERVVITVDHHGNTSAASIPLALAEAVADGRIQRGDLMLLEAMGGGFTWGGALVRF
ncbi:beta-ketoacyl-ACP synthase III [Niveispirillum cyanobacteriorum]|uniref:Beta-ketoacyl-[acyl-carrier-protein] synthase III n=1 Tax=Niveispirillum cyanobacteriorum TaxID=1612173 RepID=A0A2K9NHA2_9PROT|nr:beta-ketoacyl-ACP synthase III [Niveispirillum cyanobacteriorum]AUN32460.1 3-oxoacyl-ACP synthase [Niveispirillum cyanobacteriorum]GGE78165.1 3-oxoacyl-[acyl-carrier-protein] synthase 3 [Niveispirillum cyanobacteriorum]